MVKIYKFRIILWQDLSTAKKTLPLHIYLGYKTASSGVFNTLKTALNIRLKDYNPNKNNKKLLYEQICNTYSEAQDEKDQLEGFFFGEDDKFKTKEEINRLLSDRRVTQALNKLKDKVVKRFKDGQQLINFLNKFSIYISWDIIEIDKK